MLKNGAIIRKPVSARDLNMIAAIMFDKRQIIRHAPTHITSCDQRLIGLAERLGKLATEKDVTPSPRAQVTDA